MWTISNTNLPNTATTFNNSSVTTILKPDTELTNSGLITKLFDNSTLITTTVTSGVIDDTYQIEVDTIPTVIRSTDKIFTPAIDIENPVNGEFTYVDNVVTIYSDKTLTNVTYPKYQRVKSLSIPLISGLEGIPVIGDINITDSWQDHPSASLSLVTTINSINTFRSRFRQGSLFSIDRFTFVVNSYNEDLNTNDNIASISVGLRGKWDIYANRTIPLINSGTPTSNTNDPECQIGYEEQQNLITYLPITTLANRIGARISGISFDIKVDKTNFNATTTLNNELNNWLDIKESFIDYSDPQTIRIKRLDSVNTFTFTDGDLLSNFTTTINRTPPEPSNPSYGNLNKTINYNSLVPSTITNSNYGIVSEDINIIPKPLIYNFSTNDNFLENGNVIPEEPTKEVEPKFELRKPVRKTYTTGDPNPTVSPSNITKIDTLDLNFDRSGVTKTSIEKTEEDGFPIQEITRRYGFAYTAWNITSQTTIGGDAQVFRLLENTPGNWWRLIEETVKTYLYDEKTGYLLGYDLTGRKLLRVKTEGEDLYTQQYNISIQESDTPPGAVEQAIYNNYLFSYVPVYGAKRYRLAQHRDYYKQFESEEKFIKKCNRDGSSSWVANPNYVEPMFAIAESEEYSCFLVKDNPENIEVANSQDDIKVYQPPLSTGQETYNRTNIKILPSKNSNNQVFGNGLGGLFSSEYVGEDKYLTYTSNFTAQDPGFGSVTETTSDSESAGIPPVHTRKPPKFETIEPKKEDPKTIKPYRYIFYTEPYNGGYPRTGTYNFEKAKNINDVEKAVLNQLKIEDIRNTLSSSTTVLYNTNIRSGDKVNILANGLSCKRRVTSVVHNIKIDGLNINQTPIMTSNGSSLTLGLERDLTVSYKKEKIPKGNNISNNTLFNLIDVGFEMGDLLGSNLLTRRGK